MDNQFFVAHQYSTEKIEDMRKAVNKAFARSGLIAYYADSEIMQTHLLRKIEEKIASTQFGLYDLTECNPNVYMELGYARGVHKRHYIMLKKGSNIPANIAGFQRIEYDSYSDLTENLRKFVVPIEMEKYLDYKKSVYQNDIITISEDTILKNSYTVYQAEELRHRFGYKETDLEAKNGFAWVADLSQPYDHMVFGPYEALPTIGEYVAFYKIKISDVTLPEPVLEIDVLGGGAAARRLYATNFSNANQYQIFSLNFFNRILSANEYRICNFKQTDTINCKVWIDYIAICKRSKIEKFISTPSVQTKQ